MTKVPKQHSAQWLMPWPSLPRPGHGSHRHTDVTGPSNLFGNDRDARFAQEGVHYHGTRPDVIALVAQEGGAIRAHVHNRVRLMLSVRRAHHICSAIVYRKQ
jgi:hypothetical protein